MEHSSDPVQSHPNPTAAAFTDFTLKGTQSRFNLGPAQIRRRWLAHDPRQRLLLSALHVGLMISFCDMICKSIR